MNFPSKIACMKQIIVSDSKAKIFTNDIEFEVRVDYIKDKYFPDFEQSWLIFPLHSLDITLFF